MKILKRQQVFIFGMVLLTSACVNNPQIKAAAIETQSNETLPTPQGIPALWGTKWHYSDADGEYDIEFADKGRLKASHPLAEGSSGKHRWMQQGTIVQFYFNNRASFYKGHLSGKNLISGTATNESLRKNWTWKAVRLDD